MILDENKQRRFAIDVVHKLRDAGFESLWAGGCVRDMVLGLPAKDYDIATNARPEQVRDLFGRRRTLAIGVSFGVITVLGPPGAGQIEVATFRSDLDYVDGRRPKGIVYTTAEQDALRRDFTINGLFYDPIAGDVIDYVGGRQDIERRLVRAIGDPEARINEDKLRMLRAVRFAARFGFAIHPPTRDSIRNHADEIVQVSGERIGVEMRAMLAHTSRAIAIEQLIATGLSMSVFAELDSLDKQTLTTRLDAIARLQEPQVATTLATLLVGNSSCDVAGLAARWKLTNSESGDLTWMLANFDTVAAAQEHPWPRVQRALADRRAPQLVAMRAALVGDDNVHIIFCRERLAWPPERLNPPPLVSGSDLIDAGFAPGPAMGTLLEQIRDAQLMGQLHAKADAIALANQLS